MKLNREEYIDKLHACWIGKSIGGTMGMPYEGKIDFNDIKGFLTKSNEPVPNDDLDLQLVWLCAMEDVTPYSFGINTFADYWIDWITPHWNEYGVCKANLQAGILSPMCGEVDNEVWKTSNGAWIRSEIWAALAPGLSDIAAKYATIDASYDHGVSEGVCAEIFTASMQSMAYIESDIATLINFALSKIPEDSMTAKTVRLVIDCYNEGVPYRETRERVLELNKELGWFQAPANIAFTVIGLLYGEGDFKKSMIYAINCGDDTDCTGATVGATLGIIGGMAGIPDDWKVHVGDNIITGSVSGMYMPRMPKTCKELTERVVKLLPDVMKANNVEFEFSDGSTSVSDEEVKEYNRLTSEDVIDHTQYSYDITHYIPFNIRVEMDKEPRVSTADERRVKLTFTGTGKGMMHRKLRMRLILPDGWECENYQKTLPLLYERWGTLEMKAFRIDGFETEFAITVGENIEPVNYVYAEITSPTLAYPMMIPITFVG